MAISDETWAGVILGAVLGSRVIPLTHFGLRQALSWWRSTRPANRLLGQIVQPDEPCKIFIRDFVLDKNAAIWSVEPRVGIGRVPNVMELWGDVDGIASANIFNVLGRIGKSHNVNIMRMSDDVGEWNAHIFVIGAQSQKSFDFYRLMKNVMYRVDVDNVVDNRDERLISREEGYGYGIVMKASNPFYSDGDGIAFLIGGYGALGTAAASYYFREHYQSLGSEFGTDCFGIVVRARVSAGEQAVERVREWDRRIS
jgi:hypothetical protein